MVSAQQRFGDQFPITSHPAHPHCGQRDQVVSHSSRKGTSADPVQSGSQPQRGFDHTRDGLVSGWLRLLGSAPPHAHTDCQNTVDIHSGSEFATLRIVVALITGAVRLNSVPLVLSATRLSSSVRRDERMIRSRRASRSSPDTSIVRTRARHAYAEGSG